MRRAHNWRLLAAAPSLAFLPASCVPPAAEPARQPSPRPAEVAPPTPVPILAPSPAIEEPRDFVLRGSAEQGGAVIGKAPGGTHRLTLDGAAIPLTDDGSFLIAFDRDGATTQRLVAALADGRMVERSLSIAPGTWRIEHVNAPYRGSAANDGDFERRRPAELAQINAARATAAISDGWRQRFIWPVSGRFSGYFGSQRVYQGKPGSYHSGTDIAVPAGTPFVAPAEGVVVLAASAPFTLEGYLLIVDHGMGLNSAFLHCQSLDVKVGDRVTQGQRLGTVGATGRATGAHMHWGLKWRDARLDPSKLAASMSG